MPALVSLDGIDQAIAHLGLKKDTLRARLLQAIRSFFPTEESLAAIPAVSAEEIIRKVWATDDPEEIQRKRKNLSSLKSSLNKSFRKLSRQGKNPEGVILGRDNTFIVSDEKKDSLLETLGLGQEPAADLEEAAAAFRKLFSRAMQQQSPGAIQQVLAELERTRQHLTSLARENDPGFLPDPFPEKTGVRPEWIDSAPIPATIPLDRQAEGFAAQNGPALQEQTNAAGGQVLPDGLEILDEAEVLFEEEEPLSGEGSIEDETAPDSTREAAEILLEEIEVVDEADLIAEDEQGAGDGLGACPAGGSPGEEPLLENTPEAGEILSAEEVELVEADDPEPAMAPPPPEPDCTEEGAFPLLEEIEVVEEADLSAGLSLIDGSGEELLEEGEPGAEGEDFLAEVLSSEEIEILGEAELAPAEIQGPEAAAPLEAAAGEISGLQDEDPLLLEEAEVVFEEDLPADPAPAPPGEAAEYQGAAEGAGLLPEGAAMNGKDGELAASVAAPAESDAAWEALSPDDVEIIDELALAAGQTPGEEAGSSGEIPPGAGVSLPGDGKGGEKNAEGAGEKPPAPAPGPSPDHRPAMGAPAAVALPADEVEGGREAGLPARDEARPDKPAQDLPADGKAAGGDFRSSGLAAGGEGQNPAAGEGPSLPELVGEEDRLLRLFHLSAPRQLSIPAGDYLVGSRTPRGFDQACRRVQTEAFTIDPFPVTNELFDLFVKETGYRTEAERAGYGLVYEGRFASRIDPRTGRGVFAIGRGTSLQRVEGADWRQPAGPGSSISEKYRHPVVQVSHADALAFAAWAGRRLPTEEEWEAAARGADERPYPWGREWSPQLANVLASLHGDTTPIGCHGPAAASPFGLHDLIGNVYEWTASPYRQKAFGEDGFYILKGGSWVAGGPIAIGHRSVEKAASWSNAAGFRCAGA